VGGYSEVIAFSAVDGSNQIRSPKLSAPISSSPAIPEPDLVWIGCENGSLYCLNADLDTIRSVVQLSRNPIVAPSHVDISTGKLFIGSTGLSFHCVNAMTFRQHWSTSIQGAVQTGPWEYQNNLYLGISDGTLYNISTETGVPNWKIDTAGLIQSTPVIYRGQLYIGTDNGFVYAIDAADPSKIAVYDDNGHAFSTSPAICNQNGANQVIVAGSDGNVYGFPLK
jgi:outer membrane protein assembly factor BamB